MTTPEELTGWTLQVRMYRLKPILVATSPNVEKEYWTGLPILDQKIPIHQWFDWWDHHTQVACEAIVDLIKADLSRQAMQVKEHPDG